MNNFIFKNPVKLIMGKGTIARLSDEIPAGSRLMITFGGGSVKRNGVYEQVADALKGYDITEFWGIEPNPSIETLRKAIALGKEKNIDFILAVGGGSVADGSKLIAAGIPCDGDAWDFVSGTRRAVRTVPLGIVLTLPATGTEMNRNAVISRYETREKYGMTAAWPVFSILDPQTTFSLPAKQLANGIADTFVHVIEQYLTAAGVSRIMDRLAEGVLLALTDLAPAILAGNADYDARADFMLSATVALNGFIAMGVPQDWATHAIGHELTALHGLDHGHSLAVVLPGTMNVLRASKGDKIVQYGERIWGINSGTRDERIDAAIARTEAFFRSLGLTVRLGEEGIGDEDIAAIVRRLESRNIALGENGDVTAQTAKRIMEDRK
jgi:NADP-dependent alcohol dehydrogenase